MYDSTSGYDVPAGGDLYGVYVDGYYTATGGVIRQRFPRARQVTISATGSRSANVIDCEPGDTTPDSAAEWAAKEVAAGRLPTIYCMLSQWADVKAAVKRRLGRNAGKVSYWIAHYDGQAVIPAGAVAVQYGSPDGPVGTRPAGHFDVSAVAPYWPGVDPVPAHPVAKAFHRLRHNKRTTARQLTAELKRRGIPVKDSRDKAVLLALKAQVDRLLTSKGSK